MPVKNKGLENYIPKHTWHIPRVCPITAESFFTLKNHYGLIRKGVNKFYEELDRISLRHYNVNSPIYFGQIITLLNFCGLIRLEKEKVKSIPLLEEITKTEHNTKNQKIYINFLLAYWQSPFPGTLSEKRSEENKWQKPYIYVLKTLISLYRADQEHAYLTDKEFYFYFNEENMPDIDDINKEYAEKIIKERKNGTLKTEIPDIPDSLLGSYNSAEAVVKNRTEIHFSFLNESFFIERKSQCLYLKKSSELIKNAEKIVQKYEKDFFHFKSFQGLSQTMKRFYNSEWSKYLNDTKKFEYFSRLCDFDFKIKLNGNKNTISVPKKKRVFKKTVTGKFAERRFVNLFKNGNLKKYLFAGTLVNCTKKGCGYDFRIKKKELNQYIEVKGLSGQKGRLILTKKEWDQAKEKGDDYFLVIISDLYDDEKITVIKDPYSNINLKETIIKHYSANIGMLKN